MLNQIRQTWRKSERKSEKVIYLQTLTRGLEHESEKGKRCEICFRMRLEITTREYGINFLPADWKKRDGFKKSCLLAKQYNFYRQDYCGCIYSNNIQKTINKDKMYPLFLLIVNEFC